MNNFILERSMYYYFNLLDDKEKSLYKTFLHAVLNMKAKLKITEPFTSKQIEKISNYVINDKPDIFWYRGRLTLSSVNNVIVELEFHYTYDNNQVNNIIRNIENCAYYKMINEQLKVLKSDFEKALKLYELIIKNSEYEKRAITIGGPDYNYAYGLEGILLKHRAVCAGYAKTFQYFANKHNIRTTIVTGYAKNERHAWNLIDLYGEYYYIDATWGDPTFSDDVKKDTDYIIYDFFCFDTAKLEVSHKPVLDTPMPRCTATKYNYYEFFDMVDTYYSIERVAQHILNTLKKGENKVVIKYETQLAYQTAVEKLFVKSEVFDAIKLAGNYAKGLKVAEIRYIEDPECRMVTICL